MSEHTDEALICQMANIRSMVNSGAELVRLSRICPAALVVPRQATAIGKWKGGVIENQKRFKLAEWYLDGGQIGPPKINRKCHCHLGR